MSISKNVMGAAKRTAVRVIVKNEKPEQSDIDEIDSSGYTIYRLRIRGIDGMHIFKNNDAGAGAGAFLVPAKNGKRTYTYDFADVLAYAKTIKKICDGTLKFEESHVKLNSSKLQKDLDEACDRYFYEQRMVEKHEAPKTEEPKPEAPKAEAPKAVEHEPESPKAEELKAPENVRKVYLDGKGIHIDPMKVERLKSKEEQFEAIASYEWPDDVNNEAIGSWMWATGNTKPIKDDLKRMGYYWSRKKKAWYWKPADKVEGHHGNFGSMKSLRKHWDAA